MTGAKILNGSNLNLTAGSYSVALAAKHYSVPLIVLGAVYKLTPTFISVSDQLVIQRETDRERETDIKKDRQTDEGGSKNLERLMKVYFYKDRQSPMFSISLGCLISFRYVMKKNSLLDEKISYGKSSAILT